MDRGIQDEIRHLHQPQRTLFYALRHRFGARLGLSDAVLLYIVRNAFVPPHYAPGRSILRIGDYHDAFTVLGAGTVKITCVGANGKTVVLQVVSDGHAFGLPSLPGRSEPRQFGAVAHSSALIGVLTPDALRDVLAQLDPERWLRVLTYAWNANIGLILEKRLLLSLSVSDRLWYVLWRLSRRFPTATIRSSRVALPLTQTDLAEMVGADRSTVCRSLVALARKRRISTRRGRYIVHEPPPFVAHDPSANAPPAGSLSFLEGDAARRDVLTILRERSERMGFRARAVRAFVDHARLVVYRPGAPITLPDCSEALSLLLSGAAAVECRGPFGAPLTLLYVKPGQLVFGSGAAPQGSVGFNTTAHVESCAAVLTRDGLARVLAAMAPADMLRFLAFGWRVFAHHQRNQCLFLTMDDKDRVLQQLKQLASDFPASHEAGTIIDLPLSRTDIGRLVAATEQTVGRCLKKLELEQRIAFVGEPMKRILVRAPARRNCAA